MVLTDGTLHQLQLHIDDSSYLKLVLFFQINVCVRHQKVCSVDVYTTINNTEYESNKTTAITVSNKNTNTTQATTNYNVYQKFNIVNLIPINIPTKDQKPLLLL